MTRSIGKILLIFLLICGSSYSEKIKINNFSGGINKFSSDLDMQDNEYRTIENYYLARGSLIKRPGYEVIEDFTGSTHNYNKVISYSLSTSGVLGSDRWALFFEGFDGSTFGADSADIWPLAQANTFRQTSTYPTTDVDTLVNLTNNFEATDCVTFNSILYCTLSDANNNAAMQNVKLDARLDHNTFENFDTTGSWVTGGQAGGLTGSTTDFVEGTQSIEFDKSGVAGTFGTIERTGLTLNLGGYSSYYFTIKYTAPTIAGGGALSSVGIYFSTAGIGTDYKRYNLSSPTVSGYKTINVASPDATLGATDLSNITVILITIEVTTNATTASNARFDALTFFPKFFPLGLADVTNTITSAIGAAGVLTGTYNWRYSCVDWSGHESNMGPIGTPLVMTADQASLTSIEVCSEGNIKERNIYRIRNGGTVYYKVATIPNVGTTYTDNTPDSSLSIIGPFRGFDLNDNSKPSPAAFIEIYNNRIYLGKTNSLRSTIFMSDISGDGVEPESFPINNFEIINAHDGQALTGLNTFGFNLYSFKTSYIYKTSGIRPGALFTDLVSSDYGAANNNFVNLDNMVFFVDRSGILVMDTEDNITLISKKLETATGYDVVWTSIFPMYYDPILNQLWFSGLSKNPTSFYILNLDVSLETPVFTTYTFPTCTGGVTNNELNIFGKMIEDSGKQRLWGITNQLGRLLRFVLNTSNAFIAADNSCSIGAELLTKYYTVCGEQSDWLSEKRYDFIDFYLLTTGTSGNLQINYDFGDISGDISTGVKLTSNGVMNRYRFYPTKSTGNNLAIQFQYTGDENVAGILFKCIDMGGEN